MADGPITCEECGRIYGIEKHRATCSHSIGGREMLPEPKAVIEGLRRAITTASNDDAP